MHQIKGILQFAAVLINVMLVIMWQYQFCCVDDCNHVHYTAHIFGSRYAYSRKHHAMPVSSYVAIFQFQNHHPTGQQKQYFKNNLSILIFRKLPMPNLHLYWEWVPTWDVLACVLQQRHTMGEWAGEWIKKYSIRRQFINPNRFLGAYNKNSMIQFLATRYCVCRYSRVHFFLKNNTI